MRLSLWPACRIFALSLLLPTAIFLGGCAQDEQSAGIDNKDGREPRSGCAKPYPPADSTVKVEKPAPQSDSDEPQYAALLPPLTTEETQLTTGIPAVDRRPTTECYQPSATVAKTAVTKKTKKTKIAKKRSGRCEPQSLPFARCRSGISSCCLGGENGPLTWFACEKKQGNTDLIPREGSVLILGVNCHKMPTGHVAYVEKVVKAAPPEYRIIFSHTNYDRECSLETNIEAAYNSSTKTLDIYNGAWKGWGKKLPVAGFILR